MRYTMDQGNTAFVRRQRQHWCCLMTPGLAFFYGGLVKAKSVISMMMMSFGAIGLIGVLWVLYGYAIAFPTIATAPSVPMDDRPRPNFGLGAACSRRLTAPALPAARVRRVPGDLRDHHGRSDLRCDRRPRQVRRLDDLRRRLGDGRLLPGRELGVQLRPRRRRQLLLRRLDHARPAGLFGVGVIDFAGGTAVHINAGAAALALALVLGKRVGFQKGMPRPAQPAVRAARRRLCCGSAGSASTPAPSSPPTAPPRSRSSTRSPLRPPHCSAGSIVEKIKDGKPTSVGAASGAVAGLVAITPACGILTPGLGDRARPRRRCGLRPRDRPEVQARLRRLARRRGHPPRRWSHRNAVPRLLRQRHRPVLQRRRHPAARCRRSPPSRC